MTVGVFALVISYCLFMENFFTIEQLQIRFFFVRL